MSQHLLDLESALGRGDPLEVRALIARGADIHYVREHGYNALVDAVHGRDVYRDARLLDLLRLLIASGVDLNAVTSYKESGLRVLSHLGRFDGVRLLLENGADEQQLEWTPLIKAVALGTVDEVQNLARAGEALEETDRWSRTAWLVALLTGDLEKARLLRALGANTDARGRCGKPPLHLGIEGHHPETVRWLLGTGQDVEQTDEFGTTPLMCAVDHSDLECIDILLAAGANVDRESRSGAALGRTARKEIVRRLLDAGADPRRLSHEGRRSLCGLPEPRVSLLTVSEEEFRRAPRRVFGRANPERMQQPFWEGMIRAGISGYEAGQMLDREPHAQSPVWCAMRVGQSITFLPDGRIVLIGGEHEDYYDPDFCIYNDVFVHGVDGSIAVLGYPEEVFPPTDFHTATLVAGGIYLVGSLGYVGARTYGTTPVYRLDVESLRIERLDVGGEAPGWIYEHRADLVGPNWIRVTGGKVVTSAGGEETHTESMGAFLLDIDRRLWVRQG
jgi:ankyrin repeat protein